MTSLGGYTREELIACVEREIKLRLRSYPRWVELGRLNARQAFEETQKMRAVLAVLSALPPTPAKQLGLQIAKKS